MAPRANRLAPHANIYTYNNYVDVVDVMLLTTLTGSSNAYVQPTYFRRKLATFFIVLALSLLSLFLSSSSSSHEQRRRNLGGKYLYCCALFNQPNTGHKLTENVLDLHRCRPHARFRNTPPATASDSHLAQIANILGTRMLGKDECFDYYSRQPKSEPRMKAYSKIPAPTWIYDAFQVRDALRDAQMKVLTSCNMDAPSFNHVNITLDNDIHQQLAYRPPSTSVNIIRRGLDRVLLNAQEILDTCKGLDLHCRIIETDDLFQQQEAKDLCYVLKKFAHAVNIGMQGAENIYAHYTSGRMLLVNTRFESWDYSKPINTYRFGDELSLDEVQVAKNFITKEPTLFDWFHLEFAAHFGNYLNAIAADIDEDSLEHVKRTSNKNQCKDNPLYCANYNADVSQIKAELMTLIDKGHLLTIEKQKWWIQICETRSICLHGSRLRGDSIRSVAIDKLK